MSDSENEEIKEIHEVKEVKPKKEKAKRVMNEAMLLQLKKAREKAQATHAITTKKKALETLERVNGIIEKVEPKTKTTNTKEEVKTDAKSEVKTSIEIHAIDEVKRGKEKPKKKIKYIIEESDDEEEEIIYVKKPTKTQKVVKKKKKVVYVSSDESESEEETIEEQVIKKPSRKSQLREIELEKNRMMLEQQRKAKDYEEAKQRQILTLVSRLGLR